MTGERSTRGRFLRPAIIAVAMLVVVIAAVTVMVAMRTTGDIPEGATLVQMYATRFSPNVLRFDERTNTVVVDNKDDEAHTFTVTGLGLDVYVGPRSRRAVTVEIPRANVTHELHCAVTGHGAMVGTIRRTS